MASSDLIRYQLAVNFAGLTGDFAALQAALRNADLLDVSLVGVGGTDDDPEARELLRVDMTYTTATDFGVDVAGLAADYTASFSVGEAILYNYGVDGTESWTDMPLGYEEDEAPLPDNSNVPLSEVVVRMGGWSSTWRSKTPRPRHATDCRFPPSTFLVTSTRS